MCGCMFVYGQMCVQFAGLLESLSQLAVPKKELTLLHPSTCIGKHRRTKK